MRIAISTKNLSGYTGSARIILELAQRLARDGATVDIVGNTLNARAIKDHDAGMVAFRKNPLRRKMDRFAYIGRHLRFVRENAYDLHIGNGDELYQDVLFLHNCENYLRERLRPELPQVGNAAVSTISWIVRQILERRAFSALCANSELMKADLVRRYAVDPDRIAVLYPAVDRTRFTPAGRPESRRRFRERYGVAPHVRHLVGLVCSGDFETRGVGTFFDTFARLPEEHKRSTHLLLVGKGTLTPYKALVPEQCTFVPHTAEVAPLLRGLDLMLFPAVLETFGLVVVEALACGTPVLTSRMVGASELFTGLHAEALLDTPDSALFAERLLRFFQDQPYREGLCAEAAGMLPNLSWDAYYASFMAMLQQARLVPGQVP